ncbi:MAG TPA: TetR family transcriptional regulator [Acidimicrobiia bacterium]|nr:TetR family transcriptional regulator [Acidimicrobiia bacterium]
MAAAQPKSRAPADAARPRARRTGVRNNEAGHETRARLLDAAERLFAARGLDAVSVRDITDLADANTAAIHYHFGSKQDLIAAVLERRAAAMGRRREELLDELERQSAVGLREVVQAAIVQPTAELVAEGEGGRNYVAFLAALGSHAELMALVVDVYDPYTERCLRALERVTPDLPPDVLLQRFAVGKDLVNRLLGQPRGQVQLWVERQRPGSGRVADGLVDLLVGIFSAPVTTGADGSRTITVAGAAPAPSRRGAGPARPGRARRGAAR